ncbi:pyridoxal phosphate-dependent aminotransferase [uncultured Enterovirga sp.]|uniref:pyridoxal phosphate-dependent aminotransferase n=1 Tax=uncultured Enterovirga sp. TaxID=2026352 RepID=UPI0035C97F57
MELPPSGTLAVGERVRALRAEGHQVFNLSGGSPDPRAPIPLASPEIRPDENTLGDAWGEPALREEFARRLARIHGVQRSPRTEIVVTIGAKQALYFALLAMLEPMDEVVIVDPCWVTYGPSVALAGGCSVPVALGAGDRLDLAAVAAAVGQRTRAIIINTPHNPTGRVFTETELSALAALVSDRKLWLICDESFDLFVFDDNRHLSPGVFDAIRDQTILLYSFSKAFAMPSHRVGMLVGPESVCRLVANCTQQVISSVSLASQKVAMEALVVEPSWAPTLRQAYQRKRDACMSLLAGDSRLELTPPQGTFYLFPRVARTGLSGDAMTEHLLRAGVAVTSGAAFGTAGQDHIRINLVGPLPMIVEGVTRLVAELPA